jgi:beta-N-acetylhexosaminidase
VPARAAVRRRRAAVLATAAAAFAAGAAVGAPADGDGKGGAAAGRSPGTVAAPAAAPARRAQVDRLSLPRQVGRLVVLRFQGTTAPAYVRRILRRGEAAGAILFRDNVVSPGQLRRLTGTLHRAARLPALVCVDQEGADIRIVPWAPPAAPAGGQDPGPDARAAGRALRAAGIDVALAPVADVPAGPASIMRGRAFSADPDAAARAVAAAVRGWRAAGVAPTAKHFPGLGAATVNTDFGSATVPGHPTPADLAPFRAAIRAGVPLVMSAHATYPSVDPRHIASQSRAVLEGLLRRRLGFRGVIVTDSAEAAAVRAVASPEAAAVRFIAAGNDVVLTTGRGSWIRTFRALLAEARRSTVFRARVRASAARVVALEQSVG